VVVDIEWSGISTGTEKLLWSGRMPPFPGMGYPLVPGYESVGRVAQPARLGPPCRRTRVRARRQLLRRCARPVRRRGARLVVPAHAHCPSTNSGRTRRAAGAGRHGLPRAGGARTAQPDLIVGHGVLGRLLARLPWLAGAAPVVWETNPARREAPGLPGDRPGRPTRAATTAHLRRQRRRRMLDTLIGRLAPGGEVVLAGFYDEPLSFLPAAFMREARSASPPNGSPPTWWPCATLANPGAVAGRPDHPPRPAATPTRLPHRLWRSRLSEDDPRLENLP
jgi:3-hydroxyethyl bacteriochlorophyllide a dehydrogenase